MLLLCAWWKYLFFLFFYGGHYDYVYRYYSRCKPSIHCIRTTLCPWATVLHAWCAEDAEANEEALTCDARLMSSYTLSSPSGDNTVEGNNQSDGKPLKPVKIWLITEADRSVTTLLLPDEY